MKNRITVRHGMLFDLKQYLMRTGWTLLEPKGVYEVLRARKPGYSRPLIVYSRSEETGGCGYSINENDMKVYTAWHRDRVARGLPANFATTEEYARFRRGE